MLTCSEQSRVNKVFSNDVLFFSAEKNRADLTRLLSVNPEDKVCYFFNENLVLCWFLVTNQNVKQRYNTRVRI
jgi:hypothetical protein